MKHLIKIESAAHGVLGVRHAGLDQQYCEAGELVILKWQPDAKWGLQEAHYTDAGGNVVAIDLTTKSFTMPNKDITIGGTFKRFVVQDWTEGTNPSMGEVLIIGDNGEPTPSQLKQFSIPSMPQYDKLPTISLNFDDCLEGDEDAYEICKQYGIVCSFAFIASETNIQNKAERYLRYQRDGFSILSHSIDSQTFNATNYPTATDAFNALYLSKKRLVDAGFVVNGFVAPNSQFLSSYLPEIKKVYNYAFTGGGNNGSVAVTNDKCDISRISMEAYAYDDGSNNSLKGRINIAKAFGYNMTFYGHMRNLTETGLDANEWSYEKITTFIEYLISERDNGRIILANTDECMRNYFDPERMLRSGIVGGKTLVFNQDNTVSWS